MFASEEDAMTPRQIAILQMKCWRDLTNSEVGYALGVTEKTIKNQMSAIYRELDVQSIAGACYRLGRRDAEADPSTAALRREDV